jgi:amidase
VRNPYSLDRSASGSSSGSGAAVAANLATAALGTETDGSLVSPASFNGIVSIKPTVGLLSRTNIIPISHSQDTPGPMTRSVADAALLLTIMAGRDPADAATLSADERKTDYVAALSSASLTGKRLGYIASDIPSTDAGKIFRQALAALRAAGAEIVEIDGTTAKPPTAALDAELLILEYELKADLDAYLAGLPRGAKMKTLADVIAFNEATPRETVLFGQDLFEDAQVLGGLGDPSYLDAHDKLQNFSRGVLDELFADNRLDALISTTYDAAFRVDAIRGDTSGGDFSSFLPATAGYPHLTVPMGYVGGLPVGLSIIGPAWSEAILLQLGFAFEQATHARKPPNYTPSLESSASVAAFAPNAPEIQAR